MGENDTKNDAKRICFLEAKRRCLEKAGTYVESITEVVNYKLTKDEIRSYTAAIVKVEVVSEKITFEGESVIVKTTVKAEIDADYTKMKLEEIKKDKALQKRIKQQQKQIESLASMTRRLKVELDSSSYETSFKLRDERKQIFGNLYEANERMRKIILAKRIRVIKRKEKIDKIKRNRRLVLKYVELGMTVDEVRSIIKEISGFDSLYYIDQDKVMKYYKKQKYRYEWDEMQFTFRYDKYTNVWLLRYIFHHCFQTGYTRTVYLKSPYINILDFDLDYLVQKKKPSKDDLSKYKAKYSPTETGKNYHSKKDALRRLDYCPERIRAYLWGEDE